MFGDCVINQIVEDTKAFFKKIKIIGAIFLNIKTDSYLQFFEQIRGWFSNIFKVISCTQTFVDLKYKFGVNLAKRGLVAKLIYP